VADAHKIPVPEETQALLDADGLDRAYKSQEKVVYEEHSETIYASGTHLFDKADFFDDMSLVVGGKTQRLKQVEKTVDKLAKSGKKVKRVVGHSLGGHAAHQFGKDHPDIDIVTINAPIVGTKKLKNEKRLHSQGDPISALDFAADTIHTKTTHGYHMDDSRGGHLTKNLRSKRRSKKTGAAGEVEEPLEEILQSPAIPRNYIEVDLGHAKREHETQRHGPMRKSVLKSTPSDPDYFEGSSQLRRKPVPADVDFNKEVGEVEAMFAAEERRKQREARQQAREQDLAAALLNRRMRTET
jgi:hypothetical protein